MPPSLVAYGGIHSGGGGGTVFSTPVILVGSGEFLNNSFGENGRLEKGRWWQVGGWVGGRSPHSSPT